MSAILRETRKRPSYVVVETEDRPEQNDWRGRLIAAAERLPEQATIGHRPHEIVDRAVVPQEPQQLTGVFRVLDFAVGKVDERLKTQIACRAEGNGAGSKPPLRAIM